MAPSVARVARQQEGAAFQHAADLIEIHQRLDAERPEEEAAIRRQLQKTFAGKAVQRLAHRRAAQAQMAGQLEFVHPFAGAQAEIHHLGADCSVSAEHAVGRPARRRPRGIRAGRSVGTVMSWGMIGLYPSRTAAER